MGMATFEAVLQEVWHGPASGYAEVALHHRDGRYEVTAWRAQGDIYRWAQERLPPLLATSPGELLIDLDRAAQGAISALRPLSISEALEAGECRR